MISSLVMVGAMLAAGDVEPAAPVAMVLTTKGTVTRERGKDQQPLRAMDVLRPGDVLQAADGEAVLVLLDDGRRERLQPKSRATVSAKGCTPATAVERLENVKLSPAQLAGLRDLARSSRAGVGVLRGEPPATPQVVTPMYSTSILGTQPTFSWPPVDKADRYEVQLWSGDGQRRIWRVPTTAARLAYPEKQPALKPGTKYLWRVTARMGEDKDLGQVVDSKFSTATKAEAEELAALKPLAASADVADVLLAAVTYEAHGVHDEALALYVKLAEKLPTEANFQIALASYYERGGLTDQAKAAREKAKHLGALLPEK
jgi:hypothetical protein